MLFKSTTAACWLALSSLSLAAPAPVVEQRQAAATTTKVADSACTNGPLTRACWSDGYSIATDFDAKSPPAGQTRNFAFEITETTLDPDGSGNKRPVQLINGQYPGPVLRVNWGDTVVATVKNSLSQNGTGIHWHGVRQFDSCQSDGVPGITECPIAPGATKTYTWKATQFGTSWYHSHWTAQYGAGVVGTIIIDGPATANYDEDLGTLPLSDWYYQSAYSLDEFALHSATGPPTPTNILVNGTHVNADGGGEYFKIGPVTKGKKYRIRIINTSVDSMFYVSMDGHPFTVITSDFVPIKSYPATQLAINIGQRYDVIINANQTAGNYWFRVGLGTACTGNAMLSTGIQLGAILTYDNATFGTPTSSTNVTFGTACTDEQGIVPYVANQVPTSVVSGAGELELNSFTDTTQNNLFQWTIGGTTYKADWENPTLQHNLAGDTNYANNSNIYEMPNANQWYLWWVQNESPVPLAHPIHLHGHDFYVLKQGSGVWDQTSSGINFDNPTRRDVATLPASGHLLVAFPADNPGAWIMHCHIAWHASEGLSMQFIDQRTAIKGAIGDTSDFSSGCSSWKEWWANPSRQYNETDSGI